MNPALQVVSSEELERAAAIARWLSSYSTESGRRSMESSLRAIMRTALQVAPDAPVRIESFQWEMLADLTIFETMESCVVARYGRQRAAKYVIVMRSLLRSLAQIEFANYDAASRTLREKKVLRATNDLPSLTFTTQDIWNVLRRCRQDGNAIKGRRDLALISLAACTGARRSEIVRVELDNLSRQDSTISLLVKGGGTRIASIHRATMEHLDYWLELRGDGAGPLFPTLRRGGHIGEQSVSDHQYWKVLRERSAEADIHPVIAPHDLRRWFVTTLLENGVDVFQVARSVGHHRVDTTFRYDRRAQERLRAVVDRLDLPGLADLSEVED